MEECCICGEQLGLDFLSLSRLSPEGSTYLSILEQILEEEEKELLCLIDSGDLCHECSDVIESIELYLNKLREAKLMIINAYNEHITKQSERPGKVKRPPDPDENISESKRRAHSEEKSKLKESTEDYNIYEISYETVEEKVPSPPHQKLSPPPSSRTYANNNDDNSNLNSASLDLPVEEPASAQLLDIVLDSPARTQFSLQLEQHVWDKIMKEKDSVGSDWQAELLDILSSNIRGCDMQLVVAQKTGFSPLFTGFCKNPACSRSLQVRPSNERTLEVELSDGDCGLPEELSATVFCDYCLHKFKSDDPDHERELRDHLELAHGSDQDRVYSCVCGRNFTKKGSRNYHYKRCEGFRGQENSLPCETCGKVFRNVARLELHYRLCKRDVMCEVCSKIFSTGRSLEEHMYTAHGDSSVNIQARREYHCTECGKVFRKKYNLQSHLLMHSDMKPFICPEKDCGKRFKREITLRNHQDSTHGNKAVPLLVCNFCPAQFKSTTGLRMHVASIHEVGPSKIRRFHCSECEKAFKCMADLKTHSVTHTKLKAFSCDVCGNKFARSNGLTEHMNIHKELFKCEACGKCFGRPRYLQAHKKTCQASQRSSKGSEEEQPGKETVIVTKGVNISERPSSILPDPAPPDPESVNPASLVATSSKPILLLSKPSIIQPNQHIFQEGNPSLQLCSEHGWEEASLGCKQQQQFSST